jgi:hypothetical protein
VLSFLIDCLRLWTLWAVPLPPPQVRVAIEDLEGARVAAAEVQLCRQLQRGDRLGSRRARCVTLAETAQGIYSADRPVDGEYELTAKAVGLAQQTVRGVAIGSTSGDLGTVVLEPEVTVTGTVVDAAGNGLVGITVGALVVLPNGQRTHPAGRVETGSDGHFRLAGFTAGEGVVISAAGPHHLRLETPVVAPRSGLEVVLTRGARISGRVVDEEGEPLAPVTVTAARPGSGPSFRDTPIREAAGADGTFDIGPVPEGPWEITALFGTATVARTVEVEAAGEDVADIELVLERPDGEVTGVVVDDRGRPVVGARVTAPPNAHTESDADGRFELNGTAVGERVTIQASSEDRRRTFERVRVESGLVTEVRLVLPGPKVLTGRVVDGAGNPIAGAAVGPTLGPFAEGPGTTTGTDGAFSLEIQPHPGAQIEIRAEGFKSAVVPVATGATDLGDVVLHSGHRVAGMVRDPDGTALQGASVVALNAAGKRGGSVTSRWDGSWELELGPGEWRFEATTTAGQFGSAQARVGDPPPFVEIVADAAPRRRGRVSVDGAVAVGFPVTLASVGGSWAQAVRTDADGTFAASPPAGAAVRIVVASPDGGWRAERVVAEGRDLDVAVTLAPLTIQLLGAAPLPPGTDVFLGLAGDGGDFPRRYAVDANGRIDAGRLPLGSYTLGTSAAPRAAGVPIEHTGGPVEVVEPLR